MSVYNYIRFEFIRRKFKMQPFDSKTVLTILITAAAFGIAYWLGSFYARWVAIIVKFLVFSSIMMASIFTFRLTPDAHQLWDKVKVRFS